MSERYIIRVRGIVQGVGFRPFIYRLARRYGLKGTVYNDTEGVIIDAEGRADALGEFMKDIETQAPPLARIHRVEFWEETPRGVDGFVIGESGFTSRRTAPVPPDAAVCGDCLREFFSAGDRRYLYPFITCTNCGPRFSIIFDIPYDRENTSMAGYTMCHRCAAEYADPENRRFHTQPNACDRCGPHLDLCLPDGTVLSRDTAEIAGIAVGMIKKGDIVAIKGVGGYLIACDGLNDRAVAALRERKGRPFKPFALMTGSLERAKVFLHIGRVEEALLESPQRPIVLCRKGKDLVSPLVAPGMGSLGVMLPYTPLQHLLFSLDPSMVLIMTSGNVSDEPIIFRDNEALDELGSIADAFIRYDREIVEFCDDSVLFVEEDEPCFVRRSRGYVPAPLPAGDIKRPMLATGGDLKTSFALARGRSVIMSPFLGDMASPATGELFRRTLDHFKKIYDIEPELVVSDTHPGYFTTALADELEASGAARCRVQHHHAHIASVLEDRGLEGPVIGVAYDGTGYGDDGRLWGSEILLADRLSFERMAHFSYFPLPGGESAIRDVWKTGAALLHHCYGDTIPFPELFPGFAPVLEMIKKNINCPQSCSIGRLFDGVSAILGIRGTVSAEAEAAMLLEEAAARAMEQRDDTLTPLELSLEGSSPMTVPTDAIVRWVVEKRLEGVSTESIAAGFHRAVIACTVEACERIRDSRRINRVALSGGAFQNRLLLRGIWRALREKRFDIYTPRNVPFNDGCLALGQIAVARAMEGTTK